MELKKYRKLVLVMSKILDLDKSVFELIKEYPEVADVMKGLGFESITNPAMLSTVGRYMTIPKGASMKKIDIKSVTKELEAQGFVIKHKGEQ